MTKQEKIAEVQRMKSHGYSVQVLAGMHQVSEATIYNWLKQKADVMDWTEAPLDLHTSMFPPNGLGFYPELFNMTSYRHSI